MQPGGEKSGEDLPEMVPPVRNRWTCSSSSCCDQSVMPNDTVSAEVGLCELSASDAPQDRLQMPCLHHDGVDDTVTEAVVHDEHAGQTCDGASTMWPVRTDACSTGTMISQCNGALCEVVSYAEHACVPCKTIAAAVSDGSSPAECAGAETSKSSGDDAAAAGPVAQHEKSPQSCGGAEAVSTTFSEGSGCMENVSVRASRCPLRVDLCLEINSYLAPRSCPELLLSLIHI